MSESVEPLIISQSPELGELFAALSAAQAEITDPPKSKTATLALKTGGSYSYKYADLADLLKIIRPVFAKHGLCLLQFPTNPSRGAVTVVSRIGHKSGQWMESTLTLPVGDDRPQTIGSAITYARRYSAGGIAGLAPDEDEDGHVAQEASGKIPPPPKTPKTTKVSHDHALEVYDPYKKEHESRMTAQLLKLSVPTDKWADVSTDMEGKAMNMANIQAAIAKAMEKK